MSQLPAIVSASVLACTVMVLLPAPSACAQETLPSVSPSPSPGPYATKVQRRALAEKLAALSDVEFSAYLKEHREILTNPVIVGVLAYGEFLGQHADNEGEARVVRRAGEMARESGDPVSQAQVLWNLASTEGSLHHVDKSIVMLDEAIAMALAAKAPPKTIAGMLSARIVALVRKGEYARAMADCDRALQLSTEAHYQDGAMATLSALANIYLQQGQPAQAIPYLEQARSWAADSDRYQFYVDDNYGDVYRMLGQPAKAQEYFRRALASARKLGDENMVASLLNENAHAALEGRDFPAAHEFLQESLALAEKLGHDLERVESQVYLAELAQAEGRHVEAADLARVAFAGADAIGEREPAWKAQNTLGAALAASGKTDEALAAFHTSVSIIEEIREGAAGDEESTGAVLQQRVEPYQRLIALLSATGHPAEAFAMAENAKARVLRDILKNGRMELSAALTDDERKRQADGEERLAALNRKLQEARRAGAVPGIEKAQDELENARVEARNLRDALFSAHPEVRAREVPAQASPSAVGTALAAVCDANTLFLEYVTHPDTTTLFVAGPGNLPLETHTLPVGEKVLRERVESFRVSLANRAMNWKEAAGALGRSLLTPVGSERLAKAGRVVIVPDGPLWDLPFQALRPGESADCLIERLAVSYAPSAAFLESVHPGNAPGHSRDPQGKSGVGARLLAMGNPSLVNGEQKNPAAALMGDAFAPLPSAEDEVRELGKMYGEAESSVFLGEQAQEKIFKQEAPRYDILHLATHGLLNDTNPLYSCLLMAQTNLKPGEDGLLEAREIMGLHLRARLTILAACETARGKASAGEGQLGLSWALLVAGCPASVVSQWKVDSRSNVDLMLELHRQLRADKPADEALRQASLALRKKPGYENPFYWAPFVVIGDGR